MSWRKAYIPWYRIAETILAGSIPPFLDNEEIVKFVSRNNWLIIPVGSEKNIQKSILRSDANLYFDLSREGEIIIGFVCSTLESIRRMSNLLHGFHTIEKDKFIQELRSLDDRYKTSIERKIKKTHHFQTPEYETDFEFITNRINDTLLTQAFDRIDKIMEESDKLRKMTGKSRRTLFPIITITRIVIGRNKDKFREVLQQLQWEHICPAILYRLRLLISLNIHLFLLNPSS